jgi:tRNA(adenine34) deaminase
MMHLALEEARAAATRGEVPVGAIVYETSTGTVISRAGNTREQAQSPTGHAEIAAMEAAAKALNSWRLDACTLVVTLEPCAMCAGAIVQARVGRVVYGASDPKAGFAGSLGNLLCDARLNHRVQPIAGVQAEESAKLLKDFFAARRQQGKNQKAASASSDTSAGDAAKSPRE